MTKTPVTGADRRRSIIFGSALREPPINAVVVHRYYDPGTGQFLSVDPAVSVTNQPYGYANEDPANQVDPDGEGKPSSVSKLACAAAAFLGLSIPPQCVEE